MSIEVQAPYKQILHRPSNKWEYKMEEFKFDTDFISWLNLHGQDGWELIESHEYEVKFSRIIACHFKRPLP